MNPLYELRDRMKLTRVEFGALVKKSEATIEKYESQIAPKFSEQLARVARKHGHPDLAKLFKIASGKEQAPDDLNLAILSPDELEYLKKSLSLYRKPANDYERSVITITRELFKLRSQASKIPRRGVPDK